jgi:hypothetical protein
MLKTYSKLFQNTIRTISNWKAENRPIVALLEYAFPNKEDLLEFLDTGKILRVELCTENEEENIYAHIQYLHIFLNQDESSRFAKSSDYGYDFYFSMLLKIKNMLGDKPKPFINVNEYAWMILYQSIEDSNSFGKNEIVPIFNKFGCAENKALKMNLYHDFVPIVKMAKEGHFNKEERQEAYIHALSFNLYSLHSEKSFAEKKHLLKSLLYTLFPKEVKEIPNGVFLNPFIEENIDLIEKNYDMIIKALIEKKEQK